MDPVAQAKAFEEAEGDAQKARAFYTKHRVRRISDELKIFKAGLEASVVLNNQKEEHRFLAKKKNLRRSKFYYVLSLLIFYPFIFIFYSIPFALVPLTLDKLDYLEDIWLIMFFGGHLLCFWVTHKAAKYISTKT